MPIKKCRYSAEGGGYGRLLFGLKHRPEWKSNMKGDQWMDDR